MLPKSAVNQTRISYYILLRSSVLLFSDISIDIDVSLLLVIVIFLFGSII
jgi:hypothetical protein